MLLMPLLTRPAIAAGQIATNPQPVLRVDEELTLRPWHTDDAATVRAVYDDPETRRWHARTLEDENEARQLIATWRQSWDQETGSHWAVVDSREVLMGRVALGSMNLHEAVVGAGYWTAPAVRGRGVASRALRAASRWAFDVAGFHRLELEHSTQNPAPCRVALNAGFQPEGTRVSAALHADGWHDMHVHALIR